MDSKRGSKGRDDVNASRPSGPGDQAVGRDIGDGVSRLITDEDPNNVASYASPPCFMHEIEPSYLGYMTPSELIRFLNDMLAKCQSNRIELDRVAPLLRDPECCDLLGTVATEDARVCDIMARHVTCLGGEAEMLTEGSRLMSQTEQTCDERLRSYVRRTERMIRTLDGARFSIAEDTLRDDLSMIGQNLQRNVGCVAQVLGKHSGSISPET